MRVNMRTDTMLPAFTKSRILSEEPRRLMPYILNELPSRMNERMEQLEPTWQTSSTLKDEPNRFMP